MEMTRSPRLHSALRSAIECYRPTIVIETGTYLGMGSTRIVLDAFEGLPLEHYYSIEISKVHHRQAVANLAPFPKVSVLWGLTLDREACARFVEKDPDIPEAARKFYLGELRGEFGGEGPAVEAPDKLLEPLLQRHRGDRPLILLDSAGGIGWLEFRETLRIMGDAPYLLLLDDIQDVKHARSMLQIGADPAFVELDSFPKQGWYLGAHAAEAYRKPVLAAGAGGR